MIPQEKIALVVERIREEYRNQIRSIYIFMGYFFVMLAIKGYAVAQQLHQTSTVKGLGVEVMFTVLSVVAIPILAIRLNRLKAIDYTIDVHELADNARRRLMPLGRLVLVVAIVLVVLFFIPLLVDGWILSITSIVSLVGRQLPLFLGIVVGLLLGCAVYYVQRRKFIRFITNL